MMLRTIRVYGRLAKFLKRRKFEAAVDSAAEAIRFLLTNFPQLERHMSEQYYRVSIGTYDLTLDELHDPTGQQEIRIIPVIGGAGGDATTSILIGAAVIALSFGIGAIASAGVTLGGLGGIGTVGTAFVGLGVTLILGGVSQLLAPTTTIDETTQDPTQSYSFSGVQQSSREGVPVPICYGEVLVGSVVISSAIDTKTV